MTLLSRFACLAVLLAVAACSSPERVRITQSPGAWPPIPVRKPGPTADGSAIAAVDTRVIGQVQSVPLAPPQPRSSQPGPEPAAGGTTQQAALPAPGATSGHALPAGGVYQVQRGDTLYAIARRFSLPVRSIIEVNDLSPPYALSPGQSLRLPVQRQHRVAPGDTLYSLSRRYGVDRSQLARLNDLDPPYSLSVGQTLLIPSGSEQAETVQASLPAPAARSPSPAPAPAASGRQSVPQSAPQSEPQAAPQTAPQVKPEPASLPKQQQTVPAVPPSADGLGFLWPTQGRVIAEFGPQGDGRHNDGINIAAPRGAPVVAAERGEVVFAGSELKGFGNLLLIKHENGWVSAYAHNGSLLVSKGARVTRGQVIARVGASGNVDRPQLHFEIRKGSRAVDPRDLLPG